jgi:thiopeptide-type bacteriocin biosynthesis protein
MVATPPDFRSAGFAVVRAPVLAFDELTRLGAKLRAPSAAEHELAEASAADRVEVARRLREIVARPEVREALFLASATLDEAVGAWLADVDSSRAANVPSVVWRYLTRMAARATPFGLFSSTRLARVVDGPACLSLGNPADLIRHTRVDMHYLTELVATLEKDRALRAELRYRPSSGLYRVGDQIHFAEADNADAHSRLFRLVSVAATDVLATALERASMGALPDEIAAAIATRHREPAEDADAFVHELIDGQLLVSELQPPLTGEEPIHHVIRVLAGTYTASAIASKLASVRDKLVAVDASGVGVGTAAYHEVAGELDSLPVPADVARLYQVDLVGPTDGVRLGRRVVEEIEMATALMTRIARPLEQPELVQFCHAFRTRYGMREVPLCEALDEEVGVGFSWSSSFPSQLLEGVTLPEPASWDQREFAPRDAFLMRRLAELTASATWRWRLDDRDIAALQNRPDLTTGDTLAANVTLAARDASALERGEFQFHVRPGPAGAAQLGRFCHADRALELAVAEVLRSEERLHPDAVFAEIVHLPEGRAGNVLCRPALRSHEIPYMGVSGVDIDKQIPIHDLLVSMEGERVRLRSRRLGQWVEPRLTSAHTISGSSLAAYRFLCALRNQDWRSSAGWAWGVCDQFPHLPRVTSGRAILALEQWNLRSEDLEPLGRARDGDRFGAVRALRDRLGLPRWIAYDDGSHHALPIDLDNTLACDSFVQLVKGRPGARLFELFPCADDLVAQGSGGRYVTEFVVPLIRARLPSPAARVPVPSRARRNFAPGSEWLYAKIYCGRATADSLLRELVAPLVERATAARAVDRWFFVRFDDPDPHLRLRLHGSPAEMMAMVLPQLERATQRDGWRELRVVLDTYQREVERYGGDAGIELAESIFCADSRATLKAIGGDAGASELHGRWRLALMGAHTLLVDLGLALPQRAELTRRLRAGLASELLADRRVDQQIAARYRSLRKEIDEILDGAISANDETLRACSTAMTERSTELQPIVRELEAASGRGSLTRDLGELAAVWVHMHTNRMFAADHRAQELVLYDFLARSYASQLARARASGEAEVPSRKTWTLPR